MIQLKAPPAHASPDLFPCLARGEQIREVTCELCGDRDRKEPVFRCEKKNECTIRRYKAGASLPTCLTCDERVAPPFDGRKLILSNKQSPGDVLCMTAAIESLHTTYPGEFGTAIRSPVPEIWTNNPRIMAIGDQEPDAERIEMQYPAIHRSNQTPVTFLASYVEFLAEKIGRPLRLTTNRPHLYLTDEEKGWQDHLQHHITNGRKVPYWLVNAGVKSDYTIKQWPLEHYQAVIEATRGRIQWVQIGAAEHKHEPLKGVIDLRGKTDHRQLIRLAYHACGGLGPVTYLQHLMAAWEHPYICLVGGREPLTWIQYPRQHTFHTIGQLDCCRNGACWRARVVPLGDKDAKDNELCERPMLGGIKPVAQCMAMIQPREVVAVLERMSNAQ